MSELHLTLELSDEVYERVRRAARGMNKPVEQALATIVSAALPSLDKVPLARRRQLQRMECLSDFELRQAARSNFDPAKQRRLTTLLDKNQRGPLTKRDRQALRKLRMEADAVMLRRAYAGLLLKYRGKATENGAGAK